MLSLHHVPRAEWNPQAAATLKELFATYKAVRHLMQKRTVLKDNAGVLWENDAGQTVLFSFSQHRYDGKACEPNKVYRL
jgi:hypothetical protein